MCWKKKQTNMKDRLLFSERDIKDTDANSRSKEREVFLNLSRFKTSYAVTHRLTRFSLSIIEFDCSAEKGKHEFFKFKLGYGLILDWNHPGEIYFAAAFSGILCASLIA